MIRKIKFILIVIVAIFMVSFIPNVYAEDENYYELRLYEKHVIDDFSDEELNLLVCMTERAIRYSYDETKTYFYDLGNKLLFTGENDSSGTITIAENVTFWDNVEYTFTNTQKTELVNHYPGLSDYSGVKLMFAEEPKEECNSVCIESVVLDSKSDKIEIISNPKYQDLTVKFDIKFRELNDYVKYKIVVNNTTNEDYVISEKNDFGDSQYITYEYGYEGDNRIAKKNSKTVMYITIKYNSKVPDEKFNNGIFTENNNLVLDLGNDTSMMDILKNPNTGHNLLVIFIVLLVVVGLSLLLYKTTNKKKHLNILIIGLVLLPISIYALEKLQINVNSRIQIVKVEQFSLYGSCGASSIDYYKGYQEASHYQYEGGMTWQEWEASEYNVDHMELKKLIAPKYISPELIECQKQIEPNSNGDRPDNDLSACENKFGPQYFGPASLIVSEGLYNSTVPCPK